MKTSRRISWWGVAFLLAPFLSGIGCGGGGHQQKPTKPPVIAGVGGAKAVFIGNAATQSSTGMSTAATQATTQQLVRVNQDGSIEGVPFKNEDGATVAVEVTRVEYLSPEYLGVAFTCAFSSVTALLRISDGKLFDVTALGIDIGTAQVKGDHLLGLSATTLYDITLSSMLARPMNNPAYDSAAQRSRDTFEVDHLRNVRLPLLSNGSYSPRIFFADNSPPVLDTSWFGGPSGGYCPTATLADVNAANGHYLVVCKDDYPDPEGVTTRYQSYFVRDLTFTNIGTQFVDRPAVRIVAYSTVTGGWDTIPQVTYQYKRHTLSRFLLLSSGFFTMSSDDATGIALAWTDMPLPAISLVAGDYGYWKSGDSLYRLHLSPGSTPELLVTEANLIGWNVAGGVLIYTKYLSGTNVGTFKVVPGTAPVLLGSEDMGVQQISEL